MTLIPDTNRITKNTSTSSYPSILTTNLPLDYVTFHVETFTTIHRIEITIKQNSIHLISHNVLLLPMWKQYEIELNVILFTMN